MCMGCGLSITTIKYGIILALIAAYSYMIYSAGQRAELVKWQAQALGQQTEIDRLNKESLYREEANIMLAQNIEVQKNEALHDSDRLNAMLRAALGRVPERSVCVSRAVSENNSSGDIIDTPAVGAALSEEFKDFLVSEFRRGDELGIYAETAHNWAIGLCKTEGVICNDR